MGENLELLPNGSDPLSVSIAPGVSITQKDIRAVQLAKGAVRAAIDALMSAAGCGPKDIGKVPPGRYFRQLRGRSAISLGLIPPVPVSRVMAVGNAALGGAKMMLDQECERRGGKDCPIARHISLCEFPGFEEVFMGSPQLSPKKERVRPVFRSFEEINEKIRERKAVVVTAEEIKQIVEDEGPKEALKKVDVVTTATFGPMCSSGAFLNFGHSDPPIRMTKVWLNDVPAYAGIAAVDAYIGATELSETKGLSYGGAHVIEDLIAGREVTLRATSYGTDCYPLKQVTSVITKDTINQAVMFNPRNCYQNYGAASNTSAEPIYTYMGKLLPNLGNVSYATSGELSPLLNDPLYRTIGPGTRIFLGGADGYVAWEGTQHNPCQARGENGVPMGGAGTLALIGDLKAMNHRYIRAVVFEKMASA